MRRDRDETPIKVQRFLEFQSPAPLMLTLEAPAHTGRVHQSHPAGSAGHRGGPPEATPQAGDMARDKQLSPALSLGSCRLSKTQPPVRCWSSGMMLCAQPLPSATCSQAYATLQEPP